MICACAESIKKLANALGHLNANMTVAAAADLKAAANLALAANAAVAASAAAHAGAAASANAGLNAGLNVAAMANLSATAHLVGALRAAFGINLTVPGAAELMNQLARSLAANGLPGVVNGAPFSALGPLKALADLANAALAANGALGVNLAATSATQLHAAANAAMNANLNASASANANAALNAGAHLSATAAMQAAVRAGLGVNLSDAASVAALGHMMNGMNTNLAAMPDLGQILAAAAMQKLAEMLGLAEAVQRGLKIDPFAKGAGHSLSHAVNKMAAAGKQLSSSDSYAFQRSRNDAINRHVNEGGATQAQAVAHAQAAATAQAQALAAAGLNSVMAGLPPLPTPAMLLAALANAMAKALGVKLAQHSPCNPPACLMTPLLLVPCPKALADSAKKLAAGLARPPALPAIKVSGGATSSAGGAATASTSTTATAGATASGQGSATAAGQGTATAAAQGGASANSAGQVGATSTGQAGASATATTAARKPLP